MNYICPFTGKRCSISCEYWESEIKDNNYNKIIPLEITPKDIAEYVDKYSMLSNFGIVSQIIELIKNQNYNEFDEIPLGRCKKLIDISD